MQSGYEIVPSRAAEVVPARPRWRQAIESGTRLAVGLGAAAVDAAAGDGSGRGRVGGGGWGDALLGVTLATQRRALDVTEAVVEVGSGVAHAVASTPMARVVLDPAARLAEPFEARGRAARTEAVQNARIVAPEYASRVVDSALDVVSIDDVLQHVDMDSLLERVNVQGIIDRVDIEGLLQRVDVQGIIDRVDIDSLMGRVDVTALIERVDINDIMEKVDIEGLVENTEIGSIIAKSTGGVATEALDMVRRQGVGLDGFVFRWAKRIRRKRLRDAPLGPPLLINPPAVAAETEAGA